MNILLLGVSNMGSALVQQFVCAGHNVKLAATSLANATQVAGLNIYFGYGAGKGTNIAPTWIIRS